MNDTSISTPAQELQPASLVSESRIETPEAEVPPANPKSSSNTNAPDAKLRFFHHFQQQTAALKEQIDDLATTNPSGSQRNEAVEHCLASIARLSDEAKEASSYIPAYDQKSYADAIKALNEKLAASRKTLAPKPKFAFKTRLGQGGGKEHAGKAAPLARAGEVKSSAGGALEGSLQASRPQARGVVISGRRVERVDLPFEAEGTMTTGVISDVTRCVVDVSGANASASESARGQPAFASMQMRDVESSLLVAGRIGGPAHVTGLNGCVMVLSCRQFRMHGCKDVDVYLECGSHPIIEDCNGIRFAPLPARYLVEGKSMPGDLWDQVDDFKWLKSEPSPHWSVMPASDRLDEEVWTKVVGPGSDVGVEQGLEIVGVK